METASPADLNQAPPGTFLPLKNPTFRPIWLSTQVANFGWFVQTVAVSWLMATISPSNLMVALVQTSTTLPTFILSVFAGAIADNYSRRNIMLAGWGLVVAASAILWVLVLLDSADPWVILGCSFLMGCGFAFTEPSWHASVGDILKRREVPAGVTLISLGYNAVRSVSPALGGAVVASFGALSALTLATCSYLTLLVTIWRRKWHVRSSPLPREMMATAIYDGLRFTAMSSDIKSAILRAFSFGLGSIAILALLPLVVRDDLGSGAAVYGLLMAGFGTGASCAGLCNSQLRRLISPERLFIFANIACAACCFTLATVPPLAIAAVALAFGGAGWVTSWIGIDVTVQLASPRWVVGRTLSIYYAVTNGGIALGSCLWGAVAQHYSLHVALAGSASILLLVAVVGALLPARERREIDLDSVAFTAPELGINIKPRSGPIVVKIEYVIPESHVHAFLQEMSRRRQVQSRAGARNWNLQRDLQEPKRWTETFRTPTWTEYLRLNHRLSASDRALDKSIIELHAGDEPPHTKLSIERPTTHIRKHQDLAPFISSH